MQALIALAEIDVATAWNAMVMNNSAAFIAAFLPEPGFSDVFGERRAKLRRRRVLLWGGESSFRGRLPALPGAGCLCSGVPQAEWLRLSTMTREAKLASAVRDRAEVGGDGPRRLERHRVEWHGK